MRKLLVVSGLVSLACLPLLALKQNGASAPEQRAEATTAQVNATVQVPLAPPSAVTNPWAVHDEKQTASIKHAAYGRILEAMVVDDGKTTQVAFSVMDNAAAKQLMDQYIAWMAGLPVSQLNRVEQLAYWLNLHNALTIKKIEDLGAKGPIDRYRQFPISTSGPFAEPVVTVQGTPLSIIAIEEQVLRANFADFPYQYGLFLAAKGAPGLRGEAYSGANVKAQLDDQARRFVNNGGVSVKGNKLELSSVYEWWGPDFGASESSVRQHLISYAAPKLAAKISATGESVSYRFDRAIPTYEVRNFQNDGAEIASGSAGSRGGFGGVGGGGGGGGAGGGS